MQPNQKLVKYFDLGLSYGRLIEVKNINQIDFYQFKDSLVATLRRKLNINIAEITSNKRKANQSMQKHNKKKKKNSCLKLFSCFCAVTGGILLASNITYSNYGFIPLALSSSSMLIASILEQDRMNSLYSGSLFIVVDLLGIYRWIL